MKNKIYLELNPYKIVNYAWEKQKIKTKQGYNKLLMKIITTSYLKYYQVKTKITGNTK